MKVPLGAGRGRPPAHRATTTELRALYPFMVPDALGVDGCYIGREATGSLFCFDPWECYARGVLTGPNMVVLGQIGRGKSAFVKSFVWRQRAFGRQCWVLDPKGEYGALAEAHRSAPLRLGPGLGLRLNPLDMGSGPGLPDGPLAHQRQAELLSALLSTSLGRALLPQERAAADVALGAARQRMPVPTLPVVAEALLCPNAEDARMLGTDARGCDRTAGSSPWSCDAWSTATLPGCSTAAPQQASTSAAAMVVVDLSRLYASPALGLLIVCAISWLHNTLVVGTSARSAWSSWTKLGRS